MKSNVSGLACCILAGCAGMGRDGTSRESTRPDMASCVVYRVSQVGGTMGAWVPARLEINGSVLAKVPDRSFVAVGIPPGEVTLSATDMVNLRYADTDRMTLKDELAPGETAYFRITSVFGASCALVHEDGAGPAAYATHRFRHDSAQTSCFQRVPETVALKELKGLK